MLFMNVELTIWYCRTCVAETFRMLFNFICLFYYHVQCRSISIIVWYTMIILTLYICDSFNACLHSAYVLIENLKRKEIAWALDYPLLASTCSKLFFFFKHLLFFSRLNFSFLEMIIRTCVTLSSCLLCWLIVSALDIWTWMFFIYSNGKVVPLSHS